MTPGTLPAIDNDGSIMQSAGRHARNAVLSVFEMKGGARGLYAWTLKSAQNEADYYTKIFPKTIQKDIAIDDRRGIEDVLSAIDGEFTVVEAPAVGAPQDFSSFDAFGGGIVVGDVDYAGESVDD